MNTIEMHRSFLLKAHTLDVTEIKDMSSYDIMALLNQAQNDIISDRYFAKKYDDLRPITKSIETNTFDSSYFTGVTGTKVVDLKTITDYVYYLRSQSKMTRTYVPTVSTATYVANIPIDYSSLLFFETNGSNRPIFKNPKEIVEGDFLVVLPDYYTTILYIDVIYIRKPLELTLEVPIATTTNTCELPTNLHQTIVDRAVELSMQTINRNELNKSQNKQ